jgi:malate dehydrogenase
MRFKVSIIGAGHVGETTALRIVEKGNAYVVLLDVIKGMPEGKALDMAESAPVGGFDSRIIGSDDYETTKDSDIVVITAGIPRKPGMSRDELLDTNFRIVKEVTERVCSVSPNCIIVVVSNPLDAMTYTALKVSGFAREKVIGMAGILDSARFRSFVSWELNVSVDNIHAFVLGGHGDSMVPLPRYTTVAGVPITELLDDDTISKIVQRTRKAGGEIVSLLKEGSAYYAPSAAVAEMVDAIINDRKKVLPCSYYLQGEYGFKDVYLGVPVKLGANGVEEVFEIELNKDEKESLTKSANVVRELIEKLDRKLS